MDLDSARWTSIELLYEQALERPAVERAPFLREACGDDRALHDELVSMLSTEDTGTTLNIERLVTEARDGDGPDPLVGATLGSWRVVEILGRGGSGTVYLVERADGQYEQRAALKLVGPGLLARHAIDRFRTERQILARLVHPNIARLIDGGVTPEGTPYLVMEYVDGTPVSTYCDERRAGIDERLRLFRIVCGAVQHAHRALVVHRDLKPSNIYVSKAGEIKLLDFGIAKLLEPNAFESDTPMTRTEHRALTPAYAAPEQLRGEAVTTATDVYALGVVLYELLTAVRPLAIDRASPAEAERILTEDEPPAPSEMLRQAPPAVGESRSTTPGRLLKRLRGDLDRVCLMALRKEPERRYASVEQFSEDVGRYLDGRPVVAQPDTIGYRARRFVSRNRIAVAVAALFAALVAAFAVVASVQGRLVAAERDRARVERDKAQEVVNVLVDLFQASNPEIVPGGDRQSVGEFLQTAEARVLNGLDPRSDVKAAMTHVLGQVHAARSDFKRARALLEQALVTSRELHGADAVETITVQIDLGRLVTRLGDGDAARSILDDALARSVRVLGERHALTARALHARAFIHQDALESKAMLERALSTRRALLAPDDPELATTLDSLAVLEMEGARYAEARALFDEALRVAQARHSGRNTVAFTVTNNLAVLLLRSGDDAGAEALQRRALVLATELIGPQSIQVANGLNNLATTLSNQGRLDLALDQFREAYDRYVALLGPDHSRVANAGRNVGVALQLLERSAEARPWLERAVATNEKAEGPDARTTIYMRAQLANTLFSLGQRREALAMLQEAVRRLERLGPPDGHFTLADVRLFLGRALLADGRGAAAEPLLRGAYDYRTRLLPDGHPQRAVAACDLAAALVALGRDAEARPLRDGCVRLQTYGLADRSARERARTLVERLK